MQQTRTTPQRKLIMALMEENHAHPTADEVYDLARGQDPHISRGTVYRNLNLLAEQRRIRRLQMPDGPDHYDCVLGNHYHFFCRGCHRVFDTKLPYNERFCLTSPGLPGFITEGHRLILVGLCPDCRADGR